MSFMLKHSRRRPRPIPFRQNQTSHIERRIHKREQYNTAHNNMSPPPAISLDDSTPSSNNVLTVFQQQQLSTGSRQEETPIILDALPYVDQVHEEYEQYATSLIEQEMKNKEASSSSSGKRKLPPLAPPIHFRTPFMKEQYERLLESKGQATTTSTTETSIIDLSPPPLKDENNVEAWQDAVKRVKIGYERERIRAMLLELEKGGTDASADVGIAANEWKMHNTLLQQTESYYQELAQQQNQFVEEINLQRHVEQQKQGQELIRITTQYNELVQVKLVQLRQAVLAMEQEVQQQQQQPEQQEQQQE